MNHLKDLADYSLTTDVNNLIIGSIALIILVLIQLWLFRAFDRLHNRKPKDILFITSKHLMKFRPK